ncbi:hypothetical protein ACFLZY_02020 [Patescibacteria group bacterium]
MDDSKVRGVESESSESESSESDPSKSEATAKIQSGQKNNYGICTLCKKKRHLSSRDKNGNRICGGCYNEKVVGLHECGYCGKLSLVPYWNSDKTKRICSSCYRLRLQPKYVCMACEEKKNSHLNLEHGSICFDCYRKQGFTPSENCSLCGKEALVSYRTETGKPLCRQCCPQTDQDTQTQASEEETVTPEKTPFVRLATIVSNIGGEIKVVFDQLIELVEQGNEAAERVAKAEAALNQVRDLIEGIEFKKSTQSQVKLSRIVPATRQPKKKISKKDKKEIKLDQDLVLKCMIKLLKAKAESQKAYEAERQRSVKTLGLSRHQNRFLRIGTMFARTHGHSRTHFIKRLLTQMPEARVNGLLTDLAQCYSQIDEVTVTAGDLEHEADAV